MRTEWLRKQVLIVWTALACVSISTGVKAVASEPTPSQFPAVSESLAVSESPAVSPAASQPPMASQPVAIQWIEDLRDACDKAQRDQQKLLMFITMDGCTYCEKMKQQTFKDKSIIAELNDQFVAVSINVSKQPEIARKLKVRTFPTTMIVNSKGDVLDTIRGYQTPKQFRHRLSVATRQARR